MFQHETNYHNKIYTFETNTKKTVFVELPNCFFITIQLYFRVQISAVVYKTITITMKEYMFTPEYHILIYTNSQTRVDRQEVGEQK